MIRLFNTLSRQKEDFIPLNIPNVGMYTCGPTVYDYAHIGHARKYVGDDLIKRVLMANSLLVNHVMNITDVGHLVSDGDEGEDKLEKGAKERDMSVWEAAKFFEVDFWKNIDLLNILRPNTVARATEHIKEQIKLIKLLEEKGFIYQTDEAVYFDVSKFPDYTKLSGQKLQEKEIGVREEVKLDPKKKHPQDFVLWFFTVGHFANHTMRWPSPWGEGFPGWHIECSAMSMEYLGNSFDIHTGGIDHIPVHHTNEIAQSEGATGKPFVKYWLHHNFLLVGGEKMSKSKKNYYRLEDVIAKGYEPLSLRYLFLTAHYRDELNFVWPALEAAQKALNNLRATIRLWQEPNHIDEQFWQSFIASANNDFNIPQAVAVMWQMMASDISISSKSATILKMDEILGLGLESYVAKPLEIPQEVAKLVAERENARAKKDFTKADKLRHEIKKLGYEVEDNSQGYNIRKLSS